MSVFQRLAVANYLLLTTFRKDGTAVPTPVWSSADPVTGNELLVFTMADSGKVKRIRRNGSVLLAPCDYRGRARGDSVPGYAELVDGTEVERIRGLLARKYGLFGRAWFAFSHLWDLFRGGPARAIGIRIRTA